MSSTSVIRLLTVNLIRTFTVINVYAVQVMMEMELIVLRLKQIAPRKTFAMFTLIVFTTMLREKVLACVMKDMKAQAEVAS